MNRRELLGTANPGLILTIAVFGAASLVGLWFVLPNLPVDTVDLLGVGAIFSATTALLLPGLTMRVVGDPDGHIELVSYLVVRKVGVSAIEAILVQDALQIRLTSGDLVGTVAYPKSPAGQMVSYPRSKRAAERIESFRSSWLAANEQSAQSRSQYSVHVRTRALLTACGLAVVMFGGVLWISLTR